MDSHVMVHQKYIHSKQNVYISKQVHIQSLWFWNHLSNQAWAAF